MPIETHLSNIAATVAAGRKQLQSAAAERKADLEAAALAAAEKTNPLAEAIRKVELKLGELTHTQSRLVHWLNCAKAELAQAEKFSAQLEKAFDAGLKNKAFIETLVWQLKDNPAPLFGELIIKRLKTFIAEKETELAAVENEIADLAKTKLPEVEQ